MESFIVFCLFVYPWVCSSEECGDPERGTDWWLMQNLFTHHFFLSHQWQMSTQLKRQIMWQYYCENCFDLDYPWKGLPWVPRSYFREPVTYLDVWGAGRGRVMWKSHRTVHCCVYVIHIPHIVIWFSLFNHDFSDSFPLTSRVPSHCFDNQKGLQTPQYPLGARVTLWERLLWKSLSVRATWPGNFSQECQPALNSCKLDCSLSDRCKTCQSWGACRVHLGPPFTHKETEATKKIKWLQSHNKY